MFLNAQAANKEIWEPCLVPWILHISWPLCRGLNCDTVLLRHLFNHMLLSPNLSCLSLGILCSSTLYQIYMQYTSRSWDKLTGIWKRPQMKYSWTVITFITILWFSLLGWTTTLSSTLLNQLANFINHQLNYMNLSLLNVLSGLQKYLSTWQSHTTYRTLFAVVLQHWFFWANSYCVRNSPSFYDWVWVYKKGMKTSENLTDIYFWN